MILEKARELGIALSESDEFINMTRTREAMEADQALMDEFNEYNALHESIAQMLALDGDNQSAIQESSRDLERLHESLLANETFIAMLEAQGEFQQLMKRVNSVIGMCIGADNESNDSSQCDEQEGGCSGSCAHCSGCH